MDETYGTCVGDECFDIHDYDDHTDHDIDDECVKIHDYDEEDDDDTDHDTDDDTDDDTHDGGRWGLYYKRSFKLPLKLKP